MSCCSRDWCCSRSRDDVTGISVAITLVFLVATAHGSVCLVRLSRALNHFALVERSIADDHPGVALPGGCVSRYIKDLHTKVRLSKGRSIDPGLLLDTFEAELKQGHLSAGSSPTCCSRSACSAR